MEIANVGYMSGDISESRGFKYNYSIFRTKICLSCTFKGYIYERENTSHSKLENFLGILTQRMNHALATEWTV